MYKVIVAITTYNLEEYIAQALDSVLNQRTTFEYKIIIADDASTDKTVEILNDYQKRYPEKIEVLLSEKNLGSLANSNRLFDKIDCEYFTFLDGDDYWIGEERLQKQVEYLDSHPECSMCAGNTMYVGEKIASKLMLKDEQLNKTYSFQDYLEETMPFFHTSSILIRNSIFSKGLPKCYYDRVGTFEECALRGEDFRRIIHLEQGKLYAFDEVFSHYRIHERGVWQGSTSTRRVLEGAISSNFQRKYYKDRYGNYFDKNTKRSYCKLITHLIIQEDLLNSYGLNKKDSQLLLAYLDDIRNEKKSFKTNRWIRKIKHITVKLLMWILHS